MIIILLGVILSVAFITLLERKLMGSMQRRIGPNKVGYLGLLQPITDGIKLILKESVFPINANIGILMIAPFLVFYIALMNWLFLPLKEGLVISEINNLGILIIIALTELSIFGVLFGGFGGNSKYAILGSIRSTAQMISYSISLSLLIVVCTFINGELNLMSLLNENRGQILIMTIPLFIISAIAETNRAPFDLPEAESELVAGFFTEHSAIGFVYYFLAEYTSMLTISTLFSILYFGSVFTSLILLIIMIWIRAVLPRYRFDQLIKLGWMDILPITIGLGGIFIPTILIIIRNIS